MDFGELVVALGTFALAMGTLALAWITKRLAHSTEESVAAARDSANAERDSVEAMAMPYIIAVPRDNRATIKFVPWPNGEPGGTLELCLWNLGSGPGIVTDVRLICRGERLLQKLPRSVPIAAGNKFPEADVHPTSWPTPPATATLEIEYLHSNGRPYRTDSDVEIKRDELTCVTFRRSLAEEPGVG